MFDILTAVQQGCILSPFLFLVIDFPMRRTVDGRDYSIPRGTGKLTDLDFADDTALISASLQNVTTELQGNAAKVGRRISADKTKATAVGSTQAVSLSVQCKDIESVEHFQYLGSNISRDSDADYDIYTRIGKASSVHRRLRPVWRSKSISKDTKIRLYTSTVIMETWRTTNKTNRMLSVFNRRCLRDIMGVSWKDHMTNEELLSRAGVGDLQETVADRRRRFIGHILRLPMSRPASLVVDWMSEGGKRRLDRPKRTWRDTFREDMQTMVISGSDTHQARSVASDRARWRQLVVQCSSRNWRTKSKSKYHRKGNYDCV